MSKGHLGHHISSCPIYFYREYGHLITFGVFTHIVSRWTTMALKHHWFFDSYITWLQTCHANWFKSCSGEEYCYCSSHIMLYCVLEPFNCCYKENNVL